MKRDIEKCNYIIGEKSYSLERAKNPTVGNFILVQKRKLGTDGAVISYRNFDIGTLFTIEIGKEHFLYDFYGYAHHVEAD